MGNSATPVEKLGMIIRSVRMPVDHFFCIFHILVYHFTKKMLSQSLTCPSHPKNEEKIKHNKLCLRNFGRCSRLFPSQQPVEIHVAHSMSPKISYGPKIQQLLQPTIGGPVGSTFSDRHDTHVTDLATRIDLHCLQTSLGAFVLPVGFCETGGVRAKEMSVAKEC